MFGGYKLESLNLSVSVVRGDHSFKLLPDLNTIPNNCVRENSL